MADIPCGLMSLFPTDFIVKCVIISYCLLQLPFVCLINEKLDICKGRWHGNLLNNLCSLNYEFYLRQLSKGASMNQPFEWKLFHF